VILFKFLFYLALVHNQLFIENELTNWTYLYFTLNNTILW